MAELSQLTQRALADFRRDLRGIGPAWPKEVQKVNRKVAETGSALARARATSLGGVWARNAAAIKPRATATFGAVRISPSRAKNSKTRGATAAFWGSNQRSGWYANAAHAGSTARQHPPWVGNTWQAGVAGQGPYAINDALAAYGPQLLEEWAQGIDEVTRRAFPTR